MSTMDGPNLETWKNVTRGRVVLKRYDRLMGRLKAEMIGAGKTFHISPEDRRFNQDEAANEDLDVFSNGILCPVRLLDTEEDAREIAANPNLLSESDIVGLFEGHWRTFEKRIGDIRNLNTLERILEVGQERDATVKQIATIEERIAQLTPQTVTGQDAADPDAGPRLVDAGFRPVTPGG